MLDAFGVGSRHADDSGLEAIGLRLAALLPESVTQINGSGLSPLDVIGETSSKESVTHVTNIVVSAYRPGDVVVLVGHSSGGPVVREVSKALLAKKIPVAITAWIDPISITSTVPRSVSRALNFFYIPPLIDLCQVQGTAMITAENKSTTTVSSTRIDAPLGPATLYSRCGGHMNMDNEPLVWRTILNTILGIP